MSLSRYAGQMNVSGHILTEREARTLKPHPTDKGAMQYKLKGKLTRKFIPLAASVQVAGLTIKKVRKVRKNKGTKRGPRAKLSPIGLAGMKIMMRRGRAPKVVRRIVTPGSLMGLAGMKIMKRRGRAPKVVRRIVTPGSLMGLAGMKIMKRRGRAPKTRSARPGPVMRRYLAAVARKQRASKKRASKSPLNKLLSSLR